jgi:hypothetical protein
MDEFDTEEEVRDLDEETEGEGEGDDDGVAAAAAEGWEKEQGNKLEPKKIPLDGQDNVNLGDLLRRTMTIEGKVEFNKEGQEKVSLKGFDYTQNTDGSMVVRDRAGNTFVVAADNTLTVIRANGRVETYKPTQVNYKDGGSVGYSYGEEAGFNLVRKHRGFGRHVDTGVEISANGSQFSTTVQPGRDATYSYTPAPQKVLTQIIKKAAG